MNETHGHYAYEIHDADVHHRHYDTESGIRGLREDLSLALERVRELEDRAGALESQAPHASQLQYESGLAAADSACGWPRLGEAEETEPAAGPEVDDEGAMPEYQRPGEAGPGPAAERGARACRLAAWLALTWTRSGPAWRPAGGWPELIARCPDTAVFRPEGDRPMAPSVARQPGCERGVDTDLSLASLVACRLAGCRHRQCRRATAAHFRLVPPVPAAGTRRRFRALARMGWPAAALAARLGTAVPAGGVAGRAVERVQRGEVRELPAWLAAAVADLYDELWDVDGGCDAAAAFARTRGWAPPMAWDDNPGDPHYIDDPACPVSDWRPRRLIRVDAADRLEDIREVMAGGHGTRALAAARLGLSRDCVDKALSRAAARAS